MNLTFGSILLFFLCLQKAAALPVKQRRDAPFDSVKTRLRHHYRKTDPNEADKYFHESTFDQHYDGRFGSKRLGYEEQRQHLTAMVQAYHSTMNDIGAESWIMHGSLLGWWWNRKVMPWDSDIDVMVSEKSIHHLAAYYNMTMHHYKLPGVEEGRDYLLEVNPHYSNESLESLNKIDARWIDTDSGLFIDITTLRRNKTASSDSAQSEISCWVKDNHHYKYDDVFPLRESVFEGLSVKIPFAYAEILVEEYGESALSNQFHENHHFDAEKQEWLPSRYANGFHSGFPGGPAK